MHIQKKLLTILLLFFMISLLANVPNLFAQEGPLDGSGGGIIAFISDRDGSEEIYLMNADGSEQTRVTNNSALECFISWSADGSRMAFCSSLQGGLEIFVIDVIDISIASFGSPVRITNNSAMEMFPTWSPDGLRIAYDSGISGIAIMNADGSNISYLGTSSVTGNQPDWSPEGDRIAFSSSQGIYSIAIDGTDLQQLTTTYSLVPAWSPDGSKIAYVATDAAEDIFIMNKDGSGKKRLTTREENDFVPSWSPDGNRIVYEGSINSNDEICVIDTSGENYQRLTNVGTNRGPEWWPVKVNTSLNDNNVSLIIPNEPTLYQNYPNPFNPNTTIAFSHKKPAVTELIIFNSLGERMAEFLLGYKNIGMHEIEFDGSSFPSGVYYYMLRSATIIQTRKMLFK